MSDKPVLTFNGKKYDMESLPKDIAEVIQKIRFAESNINSKKAELMLFEEVYNLNSDKLAVMLEKQEELKE